MSGCFKVLTQTLFVSERLAVDKACYGFAYVNLGDTGVRINDIYLKPYPPGFPNLVGQQWGFVDEQGRLYDEKIFNVVFDAAPFLFPALMISQVLKRF